MDTVTISREKLMFCRNALVRQFSQLYVLYKDFYGTPAGDRKAAFEVLKVLVKEINELDDLLDVTDGRLPQEAQQLLTVDFFV